jgi:hypothetical protein
MRRRLCAQAGQTAAEYMGVLLVVSVIIAAVATTQVGRQIREEMSRIVCEIFGGDCGEPEQSEGAPPKLSDCTISEATDKVTIDAHVDLKWFTVKLDSGVEYTRQKRANGEVAMTFKLANNGGLAERLKDLVDVTVKGGPASSVTFLLANDAAANRFAAQIKESAKAMAYAPVQRFGIGDEYDIDIDFPPIETVQFEYGGGVSGSAEADDGAGGYGEGALEGAYALGYKQDVTEGRESSGYKTVYYKVNGKLSGAAGAPFIGPGYTGNLAGELTLAVTWDSDNHAKKLSLQGVGSYDSGVQFAGSQKNLAAALKYIDALELKANDRSGKKLEFQVDLALTDANEQRLALAFLSGVAPGTQVAAGNQLWHLFEQKGEIQMRTYDTDAATASAEVELPLVRAAGGGITYENTSAELTGASEYKPGVGFLPSERCVV